MSFITFSIARRMMWFPSSRLLAGSLLSSPVQSGSVRFGVMLWPREVLCAADCILCSEIDVVSAICAGFPANGLDLDRQWSFMIYLDFVVVSYFMTSEMPEVVCGFSIQIVTLCWTSLRVKFRKFLTSHTAVFMFHETHLCIKALLFL